MNRKQLLDAIKQYPYLNNTQKDMLIYFVLFSEELDLSKPIHITMSHIAEFTKINLKHAYKVINYLKKQNLIIAVNETYNNKVYKLNVDEIKKIIEYIECEKNAKRMRKDS